MYLKAKADTIRMFSRTSKKRAMIMRNKKVSNQYLLNLMTPIWEKSFAVTKIKKFFRG